MNICLPPSSGTLRASLALSTNQLTAQAILFSRPQLLCSPPRVSSRIYALHTSSQSRALRHLLLHHLLTLTTPPNIFCNFCGSHSRIGALNRRLHCIWLSASRRCSEPGAIIMIKDAQLPIKRKHRIYREDMHESPSPTMFPARHQRRRVLRVHEGRPARSSGQLVRCVTLLSVEAGIYGRGRQPPRPNITTHLIAVCTSLHTLTSLPMIYVLGVCVCFEPMNISLPVRLVNSWDAFSYTDGIYRRGPQRRREEVYVMYCMTACSWLLEIIGKSEVCVILVHFIQ